MILVLATAFAAPTATGSAASATSKATPSGALFAWTSKSHRKCATADIVLNAGGVNLLRSCFMQIPSRVLIDKDPAFTQVRHINDSTAKSLALRHTAFFTLGENVGQDHCLVPDDGLPWQPTRHPIAVDAWPADTRLSYRLHGLYRGSGEFHGNARVQWQREGDRYQTKIDIVLTSLLTTFVMTSQGEVTPQGLLPRVYEEQRSSGPRGARRAGSRAAWPPRPKTKLSRFGICLRFGTDWQP